MRKYHYRPVGAYQLSDWRFGFIVERGDGSRRLINGYASPDAKTALAASILYCVAVNRVEDRFRRVLLATILGFTAFLYSFVGFATYDSTVERLRDACVVPPSLTAHVILWPVSASVTPAKRC